MKPKIGIDIVENHRIKLNPDFLKKFLTNQEYTEFKKKPSQQDKLEFVAGRWAVKEAIFKVVNDQVKIPFNQIEISSSATGAPFIANPELKTIAISLSHEKNYSVGVALSWTQEGKTYEAVSGTIK